MKKFFTLLLAVTVIFSSAFAQDKDVGKIKEPTKKEIIQAINDSRDIQKVEQYQVKAGLNIVSQVRATWLNVTGKFKHGNAKTFDAEVLTNDTYFPLRSWMNSPKHKAILLSNHFKSIGIGKSGGIVVVRLRC